MSFEVACSECHGRLLVETPGVVVACPHCGTHLMIPEATAPAEITATTEAPVPEATAVLKTGRDPETVQPTASAEPTAPPPAETEARAGTNTSWMPRDESTEPVPDFTISAEETSEPSWTPPDETITEPAFPDFIPAAAGAPGTEAEPTSAVLTAEETADPQASLWEAPAPDDVPVENATDFSAWGEAESNPAPAFAFEPTAVMLPEPSHANTNQAATTAAESAPQPVASSSALNPEPRPTAATATVIKPRSAGGVSRNVFIAVLSYASAITIMFLYLLLSSRSADPHQLESLPDIEPPMKRDEILPVMVPPDAPMPKGHTLRLNETQRFGNVEITPLRVTRGPVEFVHFSDSKQKKPAGPATLKLWLRVKNVGKDQIVLPFGKKLVYNRFPQKDDPTRERANNFIARRADQQNGGPVALVYNLVVEDVWDLNGQEIDRRLQPGEEFETYIPSSPEATSLDGNLVWRVHFRKGYNPDSLRGVTTLIEVEFDSRDVRTAS